MIVLPVVLIYEKKGPTEHILEWLHGRQEGLLGQSQAEYHHLVRGSKQ